MPSRRAPGLHVRGNRVSGAAGRLSQDAVKVLAAVKFSTQSMTREDLEETTSLSERDVERNTQLLLRVGLIKQHTLFPSFPADGWRVYTDPEQHTQIIGILRANGYRDPDSEATREALGDYYPTGMALEGTGVQPNHGRGYPPVVAINEDLEYKTATMRLLREWRDNKRPFRPREYSEKNVQLKLDKFVWLSKKLSEIYAIPVPRVVVGVIDEVTWSEPGSSGSSNYNPAGHTITIDGKFSVVTFLHEYGHARGFDETDAVLWSVNLFKRVFPKSFARTGRSAHTLVSGTRTPSFGGLP